MIGSNRFGEFELVRVLGTPGSFGAVYEAVRDGQRFALKVLHAQVVGAIDAERFAREVKALSAIHDDNLAECADFGITETGGRACHWIAMPYLEGRTLAAELDAHGGALPEARARLIARGIALGLRALHAANVVHRDLKPANVFITDDGVVKLLDFGLARFLDYSTLTENGNFVGTLAYASPEQLRGETDLSTDLHALGVVLFEMLVGYRPFRGEVGQIVRAIERDIPEPPSALNPKVSSDLDDLVAALLEKEPLRRPASAAEVADELKLTIHAAPWSAAPYERDAEPLVFARVGGDDIEDVVNACLRGDRPTGIVVGITDAQALVPARQAAKHSGAVFAVDHLLFRLAYPNYTKTKALRQLPYSPPALPPWQPDDLRSADVSANLARAVIEEQHQCSADVWFSAHFAVGSMQDPWMLRNGRLLEDSLAARDAYDADVPLFAQLSAPLTQVLTQDDLLQLANRARRGRPDAFWLLLDGLSFDSNANQLLLALRLAVLVQDVGVPAIIARAGSLRHLFFACGVAGVETGLGRYDSFQLSYWTTGNRQGGPGRTPPRFEFPSLLCSLPAPQARSVLSSGLVPESACDCNACLMSADVDERLARTAEHNAAMLAKQRVALAGIPQPARMAMLETNIAQARAIARRLRRVPGFKYDMAHLKVWELTLEEVRRTGLLEPGKAARRAG